MSFCRFGMLSIGPTGRADVLYNVAIGASVKIRSFTCCYNAYLSFFVDI